MDATLDQLRKRHPEHEQWKAVWPDYRLAYKGGYEFLTQAGTRSTWRYGGGEVDTAVRLLPALGSPRRRFLKQLEGEPESVYMAVWDRAEYVNYLGGMLNYFDSWLFTSEPIVQAREGDEKPEWWESFERDATGNRVGFFDFIKAQFLEALLCRRSGWMLGRQGSVAEQADDEGVILTPFSAEEIWDWQCSETGELEWVVLGKSREARVFPDERRRVETITYLDRSEWSTWEVRYGDNTESADKIGEGTHGIGKVPFVMLEIPWGQWVTDKLYAWAMGLFNQWTRLRNAMLLGCIMQPYIETNETRESAASRIFGEGILLHLRAQSGDNGAERFGWITPSTEPVKFIWEHFKEAVAEGYRIIHQMSMAVDAKAVASIARSGASKTEDRKATEVILKGFGSIVREAEMRTLALLSDVYGDGTVWTVDGYDDFSLAEPMDLIQMLSLGASFGIESPTYNKRLKRKVARIMLDGEDESTMGTVEKEIDDAEDEAEEAAEMIPVPLTPPLGDDPEAEPETEDEPAPPKAA